MCMPKCICVYIFLINLDLELRRNYITMLNLVDLLSPEKYPLKIVFKNLQYFEKGTEL